MANIASNNPYQLYRWNTYAIMIVMMGRQEPSILLRGRSNENGESMMLIIFAIVDLVVSHHRDSYWLGLGC